MQEERQGMLFDQSSWGAQASLLSLLLISSQRTKKGGCSRRLSHRYLWEHPCQRCEGARGEGGEQAEYWVPFVPKLPTFLAKQLVRFGPFLEAQNPAGMELHKNCSKI